jgi:regulator of RNase E activity RraA
LKKNDEELFEIIKAKLYTSVVGDIMDKAGYLHQFLPPQIKPLHPGMMIAGRAMPVIEADMDSEALSKEYQHLAEKPFGLMLEALDDLKNNEVYICTGASPTYALWGELMATRAMKVGAAGTVVNGYSRDTKGILALNFPTFSYGRYAQDQAPRGKVIDFRVPVSIGKVKVEPGDIIIGDMDGVCVIPQSIEREVINLALEKASGEKTVKEKIQGGMSASDAFAQYGIM